MRRPKKSRAELEQLRKEQPLTYAEAPVRAGRPSKLNPKVQQILIAAIQAGNHREPSCISAGIDYTTFTRWLREGAEHPTSEYGRFRAAILKAEQDAEVTAVAHWRKAMPKDWKATQAFLAARHPARWGQRINVHVREELDAALAKIERALPPDVYEQVLEAIATGDGEAQADRAPPGSGGAEGAAADAGDDAPSEGSGGVPEELPGVREGGVADD